jgi:hypothetical protein
VAVLALGALGCLPATRLGVLWLLLVSGVVLTVSSLR